MAEIEKHVLPPKFGGGPHGLGDPNDRSLRRVEVDVLIPKIMRNRAKLEKCSDIVKQFDDCCIASGFKMVIKCRKENDAMKECMTNWYRDQQFIDECKEIYLNDRSEYRRTGIPKKEREKNKK